MFVIIYKIAHLEWLFHFEHIDFNGYFHYRHGYHVTKWYVHPSLGFVQSTQHLPKMEEPIGENFMKKQSKMHNLKIECEKRKVQKYLYRLTPSFDRTLQN
jgi:hypothetical protein